uniref:Putative Subtilisin n=1 Tax=mine drainage metagenome TaxID=410659 RepID=E6PC61_9ZZZZ
MLVACGGNGGSPAPIPTLAPTPTPIPTPTTVPTPGLCTAGIGVVPVGTATPTPGPTPVPDTRPSPTPAALSFLSVPTGISVSVNGTPIGVTPTATTPPLGSSNTNPFPNSQTLTTVSFAGGGANGAYALCVQSNANPVTILYNQSADTVGSIASVASVSRGPASIPFVRVPVRRALSVAPAAPISQNATLLEVRYDPAAVAAGRVHPFALAARSGALLARTITPSDASVRSDIVRVPAGSASLVAARLRASTGVLSVQSVQQRYPLNAALSPAPNDTLFDPLDQWDMYQIGMMHAWNYGSGWPVDVGFGLSATKIAVLDTGIDTSPSNSWAQADLISHVGIMEEDVTPVGGSSTVTTPCPTPYIGVSCPAVQDENGHGTNVAGIATAAENNGVGFAGVAGGVTLDFYKIFSGSGANATASTSDEATAIYHAVANGDRVINLSLGSSPNSGPDFTEQDAVEYALAHNVLVVAAAGNERNLGIQGLDYPAAYPGVMAVGATALNDGNACAGATWPTVSAACSAALPTADSPAPGEYVAPYSNSGPGLGVVAPGGTGSSTSDTDPLHWIANLYSTTGSPPCSTPATCYTLIAGTSMATPHVTGAAALLLSADPSLTAPQLEGLIDGTADNLNDPNQGHGRLDVYRAMAQLENDTTIAPAIPAKVQFVAFAYSNSGAVNAVPTIVDANFIAGVPVSANGAFRIADIPANAPSYHIAVWFDANGDGKVDAGDYFAASGACTASAPCTSASGLVPTVITASNFSLP